MTESSGIFRLLFVGMSICFFHMQIIYSQHVVYYSNSSNSSMFKSLVVIQCEDACFLQMRDTIAHNMSKTLSSYLLINSSKLTNPNIRDTVNYYLNTQNLDVNKVYLVIVGSEQLLKKQNEFYDQIYAYKCYFPSEGSTINNRNYQVVPLNELNFHMIINQLQRYKLWEIDIDKIKEMTIKEYRPTKTPLELGIGFTEIFPNGFNTPYDIPTHMSVFQIQINKLLDKNYKLMGDIGIGMNMPSKDNMTIETSFDGDDYELMGSSIFTWSVSIARYLKPKDDLYPFIAIGITKSNLMLMYTKQNSSQMSVKPEMYTYGSLSFTTGTEFHFSNRVNMDIKASYHFSLNTGAKINNFNVSAGVNINLQKKIKYNYHYLRMK
jgi:hypothetical protein